MDAQQFLAEFGHVANAPNGIARLRELVLVLAMQGRLLAQVEGESTSPLLEKIATEKQFLVASRAIRSPKPLPDVTNKDALHAIPDSWSWTRFGQIAIHNSGKTLDSVRNSGHPRDYITTSNLYWGRFELSGIKQMLIRDDEIEKCTAREGDLLICEGGEAGRAAVWTSREEVCFQNHVHRARFFGGINPFFAYRFFEKLNATGEINAHRKGIGISNMSSKALAMIPFPLPPLEEQSRIVAKVDELMVLCDTLDAQQQSGRTLQNKLRQSTLQAVASSQGPHELQAAWTRLADNFGRLFHAPEDVTDLRQAILDLAFTGNISEQSESVTPSLVESLHLRKMQLSAEKRVKRETPVIGFPGIAEMLGSIPDQWAWVRLNDIASVVRGGSPRPAGDPRFYGGSIPFLKVADVTAAKGMFVEGFTSTITEAGLNKTREISTRTVLLTNSGATLGVPAICEFRTTFNDGIAAFIELSDAVFDEYLYLFLKSKTKWLQDIASRGQGQPNLNTEIIRSMWFPLAPISEQRRIVARVSELMCFCDVLEANLKHVSVVGRQLASAVVSSLTGTAVEPAEEPMKAPQTELIAPLRLGTPPGIKAQAPLATLLARHNGEMSAKDAWQRFGGGIDAFYAQLKAEVAHGWILEPAPAEMRETPADAVGA